MSVRAVVAAVGVFAGWAVAARADDADTKKAAKAQAEAAQKALLKGDYDTLAGLTHPKAVAALGGKKKMVDQLTAGMTGMKANGITFDAVAVGDPSDPVRAGADLYLTVPVTLTMTIPAGRVKSDGALIGVSADGKTWTFVDTAPGREKIKTILPDLPDAVVIPKKKPPTIEKTKN